MGQRHKGHWPAMPWPAGIFCTAAAHLPHMELCPHGKHTVARGKYMQTTHLQGNAEFISERREKERGTACSDPSK